MSAMFAVPHSSYIIMATFTHPTHRKVTVNWDELETDDEKQAIVDAFRANIVERRVALKREFNPDEEEAGIPQVVRDWEQQAIEAQEHVPALEFFHPIARTKYPDWNKLSRAARVVVVRDFEKRNGGAEIPKFIKAWKTENDVKEARRLDESLAKLKPLEVDIEEQRTLWMACNEDQLELLNKQYDLLMYMLKHEDDPMWGRKEFYESYHQINDKFRQALVSESRVLLTEEKLMEETQLMHGHYIQELKVRQEEEMKETKDRWEELLYSYKKLSDTRSEAVSKTCRQIEDLRIKIMRYIDEFRVKGVLPNIGVTKGFGLQGDAVHETSFHLTNKQVAIVEKEVVPRLQRAARDYPKGIKVANGTKRMLAQHLLNRVFKNKYGIAHCDLLTVNLALEDYSIPMPEEYAKEVGWLGDTSVNYQEYFAAKRKQGDYHLQQMEQMQRAQAAAQKALKEEALKKAEAEVQKEAPSPAPTPKEAAPSNSADPVSSSLSSAETEAASEEEST